MLGEDVKSGRFVEVAAAVPRSVKVRVLKADVAARSRAGGLDISD